MTRARLYLDVDGVINAQMPLGWGHTQDGIAVAEGRGYKIRWAPGLVDAINDLDVELWYCTTWRDDAALSLGPLLGLREPDGIIHPGLDRRNQTPWNSPSITWKVPAIIQHQEESPSPFIQIDDEGLDFPGWVEETAPSLGGLVLSPQSHLGITPAQMDVVRSYLAEHNDANL